MASINFNSNDVPADEYSLIPAGDYKAVILESSIKPTKSGTGELVAIKVQIVDGEKKGRTLFHNINYKNANPTAEAIGRRELADLTKAVGLVQLSDTAQLHGKPFVARIGIEPAKDGYSESNRVKKFLPIAEASVAEVITMPKSTGAKPWEL